MGMEPNGGEQTPSHHLKLGAELNGVVIKPIGGSRFQIRCKQAPRGYTVTLQTLRNEDVEEGMNSTFWVAKVVPVRGEILVRMGDFGRLPISESMAKRYATAIKSMLGQSAATGDALGDARAMVARIGSQNHADWLTVWRLLSEPGAGQCRRMLELIDAERTALKTEPEALPALQDQMRDEFGEALETAGIRLRKLVG